MTQAEPVDCEASEDAKKIAMIEIPTENFCFDFIA
jgi:hypothetical protein